MSAISARTFFHKPAFWILTGTVMLPLNLVFATGFWIWNRLHRSNGTFSAARCLNVQITYTLVFLLPIWMAQYISSSKSWNLLPSGAMLTLICGLLFGLICLSGIAMLIFWNTRVFAGDLAGHDVGAPSRVKFFPES